MSAMVMQGSGVALGRYGSLGHEWQPQPPPPQHTASLEAVEGRIPQHVGGPNERVISQSSSLFERLQLLLRVPI